MSGPPAATAGLPAPGLELRELECFLVLSEELHFGRTGERLYVSQSRVSQLLRALESRIGARLVDRTSRRVRLTPLGEEFRTSLRPAYDALRTTVESARSAARGIEGRLTIGFQGTADDRIMRAIDVFHRRHPGCATEIAEIPLCDPFGALRSGAVDAAVTLLPVAEPDLTLGPVFPAQQQTLAVSVRHPLASRASIGAEDLATVPLISPAGPAPAYWRTPTPRPPPRRAARSPRGPPSARCRRASPSPRPAAAASCCAAPPPTTTAAATSSSSPSPACRVRSWGWSTTPAGKPPASARSVRSSRRSPGDGGHGGAEAATERAAAGADVR
ncbi:DNA-binding transcriptional regulator, LysR family [Streptomyces sp. SceaMP-e96]|nr:DNA-binding transcriptional regulator, LysR family [Streptomyces sp. SceaMP-e96]SCK58631.1 DNA-binding transcriptional regulator, LysR family [Streptomyces sp. SceaMP-e96]